MAEHLVTDVYKSSPITDLIETLGDQKKIVLKTWTDKQAN